jgi:thiol-disulfide isomerase/thioredoxin
MNKFILSLISFLLLFNFDVISQRQYLGHEEEVIIKGKIINYDRSSSPLTIQLGQSNILNSTEKHIQEIDKEGNFSFHLKVYNTQEWYLIYTEYIHLIVMPRATLYLELDDQKIAHPEFDFFNTNENANKKKSQNDFYNFQDDELGRTNYLVNEFMRTLPHIKYSFDNAYNAIKNYNIDQYVDHINQRTELYTNYYHQFINKYSCTETFKDWAIDHLKYSRWSDLLRYQWLHAHYNSIKDRDFILPDNYFDFLRQYDNNEINIFSIKHILFLHEYFMHIGHYKNESLSYNFKLYIENSPSITTKKTLEYIDSKIGNIVNGFTKELFITKYFYQFLEGQFVSVFEASYDSSYTEDPYLKYVIKYKYSQALEYLSNQNVEKYNLTSIKSDITGNIIDSLVLKYKGKVVYMDFWAPWCGPCMAEMPHMKLLQDKFKSEKVVFLFLANRCKVASWKATIANKDMQGEHILLSDDQFKVFAKNLGIGGIPHYSLLDKEGNIVNKNATRPSEAEKIFSEINSLLKK